MVATQVCATCETEVDTEEEHARADAHTAQSHFPFVRSCRLDRPEHDSVLAELYDTPWDDTPREVFFCSDECRQAYCQSGSFDYVWCDGCEREVCEQNPANGWHLQFRDHARLGYICLRCYESEILSNGQPRSDFEGYMICGGMFFSYGNIEPTTAGFREVDGFTDYFVRVPDDCRRYNQAALERIDRRHAVLTAYERLAIGGLEGFITMMARSGLP